MPVRSRVFSLLHDLNIDLLHVNLLAEFKREFGLLQELLIYGLCHLCAIVDED